MTVKLKPGTRYPVKNGNEYYDLEIREIHNDYYFLLYRNGVFVQGDFVRKGVSVFFGLLYLKGVTSDGMLEFGDRRN